MNLLSEAFGALQQYASALLHLDVHLNAWIHVMGPSVYGALVLVIFCETGLVITPFLPGDSLLFALGTLCAGESPALNLTVLGPSLIVAAVLGDAVNYAIGKKLGGALLSRPAPRYINRSHLERTRAFYECYGGKTIILARFIPIIRTFAPFVAGIGAMRYSRFALFNIVGAIAWVLSFLLMGYFFGNLPSVKQNFHYVIAVIVFISILPPAIEWLRARAFQKKVTAMTQ